MKRLERTPYDRGPHTIGAGPLSLTLGFRPAGVWIPALVAPRLDPVFPDALEPGSREDLAVALATGSVTTADLNTAIRNLISEASGWREWWAAIRLAAVSTSRETSGHLALAGLDPQSVSLAEWLNAVYVLHTRHAKPEDVFKFEASLIAPPPGIEDEWDDDGEDFHMMMSAAASLPGMR